MKGQSRDSLSQGAAGAAERHQESEALFDRAWTPGTPDADRLDALWQRLADSQAKGPRRALGRVGGIAGVLGVLIVGGASFAGWWVGHRGAGVKLGRGSETPPSWQPPVTHGFPTIEAEYALESSVVEVDRDKVAKSPTRVRPRPPRAGRATEFALGGAPASPSLLAPSKSVAADHVVDAESARLGSALARLRRDHDAAGALNELDDYLRSFPNGTLANEARLARVDALLVLDLRDAALLALSQLPLDTNLRGLQLRLVRAELRSEHQCELALGDFAAVINAEPPAALRERALRGRAKCFMQMGTRDGARRDFTEYLRRFPNGRFSDEARAIVSP